MLLNLLDLRKHPGTSTRYRFEENLSPLRVAGEEITFLDPVVVEVLVEHTGTVLIVRGLIVTRVGLFCNRCLRAIDYPVQVHFELPFVYREDLEEVGIVVDSDQEAENYEIFEEKPVNLRDLVLENIIMAIPMSISCHAYCKGLCFQCGTDLNEENCHCQPDDFDPRLAVLKDLLKPKN